ncbi:hypothetical protein BJY52DRAFT_1414442 [Lactarius psammicola]|nr:hypothetical protein BJY52DRAFT_1414442 [Lactarius psammicola]
MLGGHSRHTFVAVHTPDDYVLPMAMDRVTAEPTGLGRTIHCLVALFSLHDAYNDLNLPPWPNGGLIRRKSRDGASPWVGRRLGLARYREAIRCRTLSALQARPNKILNFTCTAYGDSMNASFFDRPQRMVPIFPEHVMTAPLRNLASAAFERGPRGGPGARRPPANSRKAIDPMMFFLDTFIPEYVSKTKMVGFVH